MWLHVTDIYIIFEATVVCHEYPAQVPNTGECSVMHR